MAASEWTVAKTEPYVETVAPQNKWTVAKTEPYVESPAAPPVPSTATDIRAEAQARQDAASQGPEQISIPQAELADAERNVAALTRELRRKGVNTGPRPAIGSTKAGDYLLAQGTKVQGQQPADVVAPPAPPPAPALVPPKPQVATAAPVSTVSGADDAWAAINDAAAAPAPLAVEKSPRALPPVSAAQTALNMAGVSPQYVASLKAEYNQLDPAKRIVALQQALQANPPNTVKGRAVRAVAADDAAWNAAISKTPAARLLSPRIEDVAANIKARYPERPDELIMQDAQRAMARGQSDIDYGSVQALTKEQSDAMDAAAVAKANAEKSKKLSYADIGTSNLFGGLSDVALAGAQSMTDAFGATDKTKQLAAMRKSVQSFMQQHGGDTTFGKVMSATGAITPAVIEGLAIPFTGGGSLIPLLSSGILYGLPGFKETLAEQLKSGASVDVALEHALAAGGMMMFGGRLVATGGKVLPQGLKAGDRLLPQMTAAAAEGTAFSAADTGIQKTIDVLNGRDTNAPALDPASMVTTALSMALARGAHVGVSNLQGKAAADARIPYAKDNSYTGLAQRIAEAKGFNFKPAEPALGKSTAAPVSAEPALGKPLVEAATTNRAEPELGNLENIQAGEEPPFAKGEAAPVTEAAPAAEVAPSEKAIAEKLQAQGVSGPLARRMAKKQVAEEQGARAAGPAAAQPPDEIQVERGFAAPQDMSKLTAWPDALLTETLKMQEAKEAPNKPLVEALQAELQRRAQTQGAEDVAGTEPTPSGESVSVAGEPGTEAPGGLETPARDGVVSAESDARLAATGKGPEPSALTETEKGKPSGTETVEAKQAKAQEQEAPAAVGFRPANEAEKKIYHLRNKEMFGLPDGSKVAFDSDGDGFVYSATGTSDEGVIRYTDNRRGVIKAPADFPAYVPESLRQPLIDYHNALSRHIKEKAAKEPVDAARAKLEQAAAALNSKIETKAEAKTEAKTETPAAAVEDIAIEPEVSPPSKGVINAFEAAKRRIPIGESIGEQIAKEEAKEKADRKKVKDYEAAEKERKAEEDRVAKEEKATAEEQAAAETTERDAAAKARAGAVDVLGMEPQITGALQEIINSPRFPPNIRKQARFRLDSITESNKSTGEHQEAKENTLEIAFNFVTEQASKPRFMRQGKKPLPSIGQDKVSSIIDTIKARWGNAPEVVVARDINDSAVPTELQAADREAVARGATGVANGVLHKGKVYIFADQMTSTKDVVETLLHETLGHYGLRGVFGKGLKPILEQVARDFPNEMQALKGKYGLDFNNPKHVAEAAEEVLANLAATKPNAGIVQRAIAAVRRGLRKIGMDIKLSNNDLIANYILPARNFVEGERVNRATEGQPGFSRAAPTPEERAKETKKATDAVKTSRIGYDLGKAVNNLAKLRDPRYIAGEVKGVYDASTLEGRKTISHFYDSEGLAYGGPGDVITGLKDAHEAIQKLTGSTQTYMRGVARVSEDIVDFFRAEPGKREAFEDLANESTLAKYDPSNPPAGAPDAKLDADYAALGEKGQKLYQNLRDYYKSMNEVKQHLLEENLDKLDLPQEGREKLMASIRQTFEADSVKPYFPLARFGDYVLETNLPGQPKASYRFESVMERDRAAREFAAQQGRSVEELKGDGALTTSTDSNGGGLRANIEKSSELLKDAYEAIDSANMADSKVKQQLKDSLYQAYLAAMPEGSVRKMFIHRKGTPGFSSDILRAVNDTGAKMSRAFAKLEHSADIRSAIELSRRQLENNDAYEPFVKRMEEFAAAALEPKTSTDVEKFFDSAAGFVAKVSFLRNLTSWSSAIMQPMDVMLKGAPVLTGNHGPKAMVELSKMAKLYNQFGVLEKMPDGTTRFRAPSIEYASGLTDVERRAVRDMVDTYGITKETLANDVFSQAKTPTTKVDSKLWEVGTDAVHTLVLGGLMHHGERLSREIIALTSFRLHLAEQEKKSPGNPLNYHEAVKAAVRETNEVLGNYNANNKPMIMRGASGKLLGMYKFFPFLTTKLLVGNFFKMLPMLNKQGKMAAATKFFGVLGTHMLFGGLVALPAFSMVMNLLQKAWAQWQRDPDAPTDMRDVDYETWFRTVHLPEWLGKTGLDDLAKKAGIKDLSNLAEYGALNYLTGSDISSRLSLNDMWLRDPQPGKTPKDTVLNWAQALGGPVVTTTLSYVDGINLMTQGEYERGLEKMLPASISKLMTANRYAKEGVQTPQGIQLAAKGKVPMNELVGQAIGYAPARIAEAQTLGFKAKAAEKVIDTQKANIVSSIKKAYIAANDDSKPSEYQARFEDRFEKAIADAQEFNLRNPKKKIDLSKVREEIKKMNKANIRAEETGGINLTKKNIDLLEPVSDAAVKALAPYQ